MNVCAISLPKKMETVGIPLSKYVQGKIFAGIKTGLNKAFWLSQEEYQSLVQRQPNCAKIIKPLLVGDDIRRWRAKETHRWLIYTLRGIDISPGISDGKQFRAFLSNSITQRHRF